MYSAHSIHVWHVTFYAFSCIYSLFFSVPPSLPPSLSPFLPLSSLSLSTSVQKELEETCSNLEFLNERGHNVYQRSLEKAQSMATDLESRVQASMEGILNHIASELLPFLFEI